MSRTVRGTRRDAERELSRLLVEVDEGRYVASPPMTLDELLDRWLEVKRQHVEPSDVDQLRVGRPHVPAAGARRPQGRRAAARSISTCSTRDLGGRGLSARTVRICHTVLRQSLEQARRWGLIARNPAVDATPPTAAPQGGGRRRRVDQVLDLLDAAYDEEPAFGAYLWV